MKPRVSCAFPLYALFTLLSISGLLPSSQAATVTIVDNIRNGSFESLVDPSAYCTPTSGSNYVNCGSGASVLMRPWTLQLSTQRFDTCAPPDTACSDGVRCIDLSASTGSTVYQSGFVHPLELTVGLLYRVSIDFGTRFVYLIDTIMNCRVVGWRLSVYFISPTF